MAKFDTRTIKSNTCKKLAIIIKTQTDNDYTELACAALQDIFTDEQIYDEPNSMLVCNEDDDVIFSLVYLAERLTQEIGNHISEYISHLGDEIAETVEC